MTQASESSLVFFSCGGTIEKIYQPDTGKLSFDHSRVSDWVNQCRITQPWRAKTLMLIDSLDMTDSDRELVGRSVSEASESRIVILHGTDTMVQTAKVVMLHRKQHQTVVFTGAMIPACIEGSEARFNLGLATAAVQTMPPGVYVAMNGRIWPADRVIKDQQQGCFVSLSLADTESAKDLTK